MTVKVNGRLIQPGTELSIHGESGRFLFRYMTGDHLTCWGGRTGYEKWRTFPIEKVRRVHRKPKMRGGA